MTLSETDLIHLRRCVELATEALDAGDEPFGSVLVGAGGNVLAQERNRVVTGGDATRHPEIDLARWAAEHLDAGGRAAATVYTSGEHCPMCSAAHAWVGLGRIVYAVSSQQLDDWLTAWGVDGPSPVTSQPITAVAPGLVVDGPAPDLTDVMRRLHRALFDRAG